MSRRPILAKLLIPTLTLAGALLVAPRVAQAGCSQDCEAVRSAGVTITPALDCLFEEAAPDLNTCTCSVRFSYRNDCAHPVEIVPETSEPCVGCTSRKTIFASGESTSFDVGVSVPPAASGARYTKRASERFTVTEQNAEKTTHVLEASMDADIDPEAGGCQISTRGAARRGAASPLTVLGLFALALGARRLRAARRAAGAR